MSEKKSNQSKPDFFESNIKNYGTGLRVETSFGTGLGAATFTSGFGADVGATGFGTDVGAAGFDAGLGAAGFGAGRLGARGASYGGASLGSPVASYGGAGLGGPGTSYGGAGLGGPGTSYGGSGVGGLDAGYGPSLGASAGYGYSGVLGGGLGTSVGITSRNLASYIGQTLVGVPTKVEHAVLPTVDMFSFPVKKTLFFDTDKTARFITINYNDLCDMAEHKIGVLDFQRKQSRDNQQALKKLADESQQTIKKAIQEEAHYRNRLEADFRGQQALEEKHSDDMAKASSYLEDLHIGNKVSTLRCLGKVELIFAESTLQETQSWFAELGVNPTSLVENTKKAYNLATCVRRVLCVAGFRFNPLCVDPDFKLTVQEGEGWDAFRADTVALLGFGQDRMASSVTPTATNATSPRRSPPKSPSTIVDKDNAAVTNYLTSNPEMCSHFAQASMNTASEDPDTREDAKTTIKRITELAVDCDNKRKAEVPATDTELDLGRPSKRIKTSAVTPGGTKTGTNVTPGDAKTDTNVAPGGAKTEIDVAASTSSGDNSLVNNKD
eukprot:CAMPEP_0113459760 /NCGR_PEP_ID=MMETSP0014_2-20120614/10628_1 /TAXON_ID=2857 /ORGANISM="Nitzschia sp." /LENGTH=552 /DNA_ID=CAMNT_0000351373 /DNA_START=544 /DNA_END=2202 /DNA_ORIENTATION=+ /assembly_acc=CAM_ASM_000159